jgi:F-type H+-transporting ATPase subunit a
LAFEMIRKVYTFAAIFNEGHKNSINSMKLEIKFSTIIAAVALILVPFIGAAQGHGEHKPEGHNQPAPTEQHATPTHEAQPAHGENHEMQPVTEHGGEAVHAMEEVHGDAHATSDKYDPTPNIMEHIGNSNEFHIAGEGADAISIPLPCILYSQKDGITTCLSSVFHHGHIAHNKYVMFEGVVRRINDEGLAAFPREDTEIGHPHVTKVGDKENASIEYMGITYPLENHSIIGESSSFIDFSISKNVATMLLGAALLCFIFFSMANAYKTRKGQAPRGLQNFMEPVVNVIIDDVAKPMLGDRYMRFLPYLLTIFFFILINNLMGLIPFFPGGANVTGNIATTMVLALITFIITNLNGNKDYWKHIFWMPDVPVAMKVFLAPIELIGVFVKPVSLMIRLFANITAGHIIILALVSLIFVFGNVGKSLLGATAGTFVAVPFTLFLSIIELVVAFIQAFIFTILSASYFAAATEEHHH